MEPEGGGALKYVVMAVVGLLVAGGVAALIVLKQMKTDKEPGGGDSPAPSATSAP